jgi:acyl transferase domain-containing protein
VTIDTACSSSLVALHDALRDLRMGLCTLAIVAGVNLTLLPALSDMLSDAGLLSAHRCRPFDETADGYVRGEGVGVVVLRRLEHAFNGHDRIYALLRGAAVRHDGGGQGGVAIPSEVGQRDLLRAAYSDARVEPSQVRHT